MLSGGTDKYSFRIRLGGKLDLIAKPLGQLLGEGLYGAVIGALDQQFTALAHKKQAMMPDNLRHVIRFDRPPTARSSQKLFPF